MQTSFLKSLIGDSKSTDSLGEIVFPKGFEVSDFEKLRTEFNSLACRYGLTLPAKLRRGQLVLECKPLPGEKNHYDIERKVSDLTIDEISAITKSFD